MQKFQTKSWQIQLHGEKMSPCDQTGLITGMQDRQSQT